MRRVGSWEKVLELSGLTTRGHGFPVYEDELIADIKAVGKLLGKDQITAEEYVQYGRYGLNTIKRKVGWNKALILAGLKINKNTNFSNEDLFAEIERIWIALGRQPSSTEIRNGISIYSYQSYARRFGGWRSALKSFIEYVNAQPPEASGANDNDIEELEPNTLEKKGYKHKTKREINLRLRFKVMLRDNFKCYYCGASPARDPNVVLHVDHIEAWVNGGETVIENLRTSCSNCNLGKGDLDITKSHK